MGSQEQAAPLETIAGLHGCITRWQDAGANGGGLLYPRNGDALVPLPAETPAALSARLRSEHDQAALLEVNGFSGWTVQLNGEAVARRDLIPGWGNCFPLTLRRGENRLDLAVEAKEGPLFLGARLLGENRQPISDVSQVFTPPASELEGQLDPSTSPLAYYNRLTNEPCELRLDAFAGAEAWRRALRGRLEELLGVPPPPDSPEVELVHSVGDDGYVRERRMLVLDEHGSRLPFWLLLPEKPNGATLLCLHGHGYAYGETVGLPGAPVARQREVVRDYNFDYARQAARRGYVAVTPDFRGFGERGDHERGGRDPCDANFFRVNQYGLNMVALQLHDLRALLNHLATRPEVDLDRLGCIGLSYGGRMTMYAAATDERIRVAVVSGALNSFKERLLRNMSCGAQFVPGLLRCADVPELLGLVAPRPLFLEVGCRDGTSPELFAAELYHQVQRIYEAAGVPNHLGLEIYEWGHRFNGQGVWPWIEERL